MKHQGKAVLFDIDHTLSDANWRNHMLPACYALGGTWWDDYHRASGVDSPCDDVIQLVNNFRHCDHPVIGITARPGKFRTLTRNWLQMHKVNLDELLMRPDEDFRPSAELKLALARERFGERISDEVLFIIDDHPEVVKAFQAAGVTALQVHGREYK